MSLGILMKGLTCPLRDPTEEDTSNWQVKIILENGHARNRPVMYGNNLPASPDPSLV
jgi:hypothetical protein